MLAALLINVKKKKKNGSQCQTTDKSNEKTPELNRGIFREFNYYCKMRFICGLGKGNSQKNLYVKMSHERKLIIYS